MNKEAATWFIHHLDDVSPTIAHAPDDVQKWLKGLDLPFGLLLFLQWDWPQAPSYIGPVGIDPSSSLPKHPWIEALIAHKLLPIGSGANGDVFAIDYSAESCSVGYVTHEEYYGEGDPRPFFEPAARSIETFLYIATEDRYFPCDYYAAKAHNQFLRDETAHFPYPPYETRNNEQ